MANQVIIDFIKVARKKNYPDDMLRRGLLEKGWPLTEINLAFHELNTQKQTFTPYVIPQQTQAKPQSRTEKKEIPHQKFSLKWVGAGIGIFVLLSITISVFFYMNGLMDYTVIDPVTQKEFTKRCLSTDCSDLKAYAFSAMKEKFLLALFFAFILTSLILGIYRVVKFKKALLWILNILYFGVLLILFYLWFQFSK